MTKTSLDVLYVAFFAGVVALVSYLVVSLIPVNPCGTKQICDRIEIPAWEVNREAKRDFGDI